MEELWWIQIQELIQKECSLLAAAVVSNFILRETEYTLHNIDIINQSFSKL